MCTAFCACQMPLVCTVLHVKMRVCWCTLYSPPRPVRSGHSCWLSRLKLGSKAGRSCSSVVRVRSRAAFRLVAAGARPWSMHFCQEGVRGCYERNCILNFLIPDPRLLTLELLCRTASTVPWCASSACHALAHYHEPAGTLCQDGLSSTRIATRAWCEVCWTL
jgi:hypothetical protein